MAIEYKVEKGVPPPETHTSKYPFKSMAVGDSFFAPGGSRLAIGAYAAKALGKSNYTVRSVDGGVRVWRLA